MNSASEKFASGVASEYGKLGGVIAGVATAAVTAAAAIAAAGAAALVGWTVEGIQQAGDLEAQISGIAAVMGIAKDEAAPLADVISDLSIDPSLKVNTTEAADAIELLARNGVSMADIMDGAARSTVLLANATGADFGTAADIATDALSIFNLSMDDMQAGVNGITSVVNNSKFDINDYALALSRGGVSAAAAGVTFDDFNSIIAFTASSFSSGQTAGTGWANLLTRLVPISDAAAEEMQRLGIITEDGTNRFFDANGELKSMDEIIQILNESFGALTTEQRMNVAQTIFGRDAANALNSVIGKSAEEYLAFKDVLAQTDAEESARTRMDNLAGAMEILGGIMEAIQIQAGAKFLPMLTDLARLLAEVLEGRAEQIVGVFGTLAEWMASSVQAAMPLIEEALPQIIDNLIALAEWAVEAATTGNLWNAALEQMHPSLRTWMENIIGAGEAISALVGKVGEIIDWFTQAIEPLTSFIAAHVQIQDVLIAAAGAVVVFLAPLALAIAKMAAVGAAAVAAVALIRTAWEQDLGGIATFVTEAWNRIVEAVEWAMATLEQAWSTHGEAITTAATTAWEGVQKVIQTVWDAIVALIEAVWPRIEEIVRKGQEVIEALFSNHGETVGGVFQAMWDAASQIVETAWQNIQTIIEMGLDIVSGLLDVLVALLEGDWAGAWEAAQNVVQTAWDGIVEIATNSFELLSSLFETYGTPIIEWFTETFPQAGEVLAEALDNILAAWEGLWEALQGLMETIRSETSDWMETLEQFWADHGEAIMEIVDRWLAFIIQLVTTALENLALLITAALQAIQGDWEGAWESIKAAMENTWELIQAAAVLAWETLKTLFQVSLADIVEQMRQGAQDAVDRFVEGLQNLGTRAGEAISSAISTMTSPLSGLADTFRSYAEGAGQAFTSALSGAVAGAQAAASNFGNAVTGALGLSLDSQSPSRVFMRHGEWAGEGFVIGLDNLIAAAKRKVQQMVDATLSVMGDMGVDGGGLNRMVGSRVESAGMAAAASTIQSFSTTNSVMNQFGPVHVSTPMDWAEMEFRIRRIIDDLV